MKAQKSLIFLILAVCVTPILMAGIAPLKLGALVPTPAEKGVTGTHVPDQSLHKVAPTYYKDYYSKTKVLVYHPVTSTLYAPVEYQTTDTESSIFSTFGPQTIYNQTTAHIQSSMIETITPTTVYETFEWPTEVQMFTKHINETSFINVTQTVENGLPFL